MEVTEAAEAGDIVKLELLLKSEEEDVKLNLDTALVKAAKKEKWDCVKLLVKAGAGPNAEGHHWRALNFAVIHGNVNCVDLLIKAGADVNYFNRTTCLRITDNVEIAELLIKAGGNVNATDYDDMVTPLIGAACAGRADLIKLYLDSGADANMSCMNGATALGQAGYRNYPDCVKLLVPHTDGKGESFLVASKSGNIESLQVFMDLGIDVNEKISVHEQRQRNKVTALMKAASGGEVECIKFLLKSGASSEILDDFGNNALMCASMACKVKAMEYLIQLGMDVNACNQRKETVLMKVIDQPYVRYFYAGTSRTEQNDCHSECVKILVDSGADVNKQNTEGDTALNLAAKQNQPEYIKILLKAGAQINIFNKTGNNALMCHTVESKRKNEDLKRLLVAAGESRKQFKCKVTNSSGIISKLNGHLTFFSSNGNQSKESTSRTTVYDIDWNCWKDETASEEVLNLKELCREAVRKCLLQLNPFRSLFETVLMLGLPRALNDYMMYYTDLTITMTTTEEEEN